MAEARLLFETAEDVNQKLGNTVILQKGEPVYVKGVAEAVHNPKNLKIFVGDLPLFRTAKDFRKESLWDTSLDWKSISTKIGYCNASKHDQKEALFIQRVPIRKSIQGLSGYNTKISHWSANPVFGNDVQSVSLDSLMRDDGFVEMFRNNYPDARTAGSCLIKDGTMISVAISRYFAIVSKQVGPFYLAYKGTEIGWSDDPTYRWKIGKTFEHLQETLEYNQIAYVR